MRKGCPDDHGFVVRILCVAPRSDDCAAIAASRTESIIITVQHGRRTQSCWGESLLVWNSCSVGWRQIKGCASRNVTSDEYKIAMTWHGNNSRKRREMPPQTAVLMVRDRADQVTADKLAGSNCAFLNPAEPAFAAAANQVNQEESNKSSTSEAEEPHNSAQPQRRCFVYAHDRPKCLALVRFDADVPVGSILLSDVQCLNFEVCANSQATWTLVVEDEDAPLPELNFVCTEIRPRWPLSSPHAASGDGDEVGTPQQTHAPREENALASGPELEKALRLHLWGTCVSMYERFVVCVRGVEYVARVTEVGVRDAEESVADYLIPDAYQGIFDDATQIYLTQDTSLYSDAWTLTGAIPRPEVVVDKSMVTITTNDDEEFVVKKKLMFPCIALASAVVDPEQTTAEVDVDCLTFDRVLLYLEAEAAGRQDDYEINEEHTQALLRASEKLGLIGLTNLCKAKLGEFSTRVRKTGIPYEEIVERNNAGEVLLIVDGMVLDVTRWLRFHPGGQDIIPRQAKNIDSVAMFEMYHASRQSFRFLKQFYIGEVRPSDRERIPGTESYVPSAGFLEQLRAFTTWRVEPKEAAPRLHLGQH